MVDALLLTVFTGYLVSFFDLRLMALDSTPAGGDMASWAYEARHLAQVLLPAGRLTGWDMGHFAGQPAFQFYFLPPFLLAVLPSLLGGLPPAVGLKVAMAAGMVGFPVSVYAGLRLMGCRFPSPAIGAAAALMLVMSEGHAMFGGNALSTLAGEFCYMTALALLPLVAGRFYQDAWQGRRPGANGVFWGLLGLSHPFVFLPALGIWVYGYLTGVRPRYLLALGVVTGATMAFWLLPLLALRGAYTTPIDMVWHAFDTPRAAAAALWGTAVVLGVPIGRRLRSRGPFRLREVEHGLIWAMALTVAAAVVAATGVSWLRASPAALAALVGGYIVRRRRGFDAVCRGAEIGAGMLLAAGAGAQLPGMVLWFAGTTPAGAAIPDGLRWAAAAGAAAVVGTVAVLRPAEGRAGAGVPGIVPDRLGLWLALLAGGAAAYGGAHLLRVPDIRFLPVCLYALAMVAATELLGPLIARWSFPLRVMGGVTLAALALCWSAVEARQAGAWYRYNYRGFEQAPGWPEFAALNRYLNQNAHPAGGPLNAGRVGYEKCDLYGAYGGDRAFEALPLVSGRATLEGIHYAGALGARCVAFMQATYSRDLKTPEPLVLPRMNAAAAAAYGRLYNVSHLVVATDEAKGLLAASPSFEREAVFGPLWLFRLRAGGEGYVQVPDKRPLRYTGAHWRKAFYRWFRDYRNLDLLMVPDRFVTDPRDRAVLSETLDDLALGRPQAVGRLPAAGARVRVAMDHHRIRFSTNRVGVPHLVKVSYFPNWRVEGANGVYPVSPHFMLVIPRQATVTLSYGRSPWEIAGTAVTGGWLLGVAAWGLGRRFGTPLPVGAAGLALALERGLARFDRGMTRLRPVVVWALVAGAVLVAVSAVGFRNRPTRIFNAGDAAYARGAALLARGDEQTAARAFRSAVDILGPLLAERERYDHRDVVNAMLRTAESLEILGRRRDAEGWYRVLLREFHFSRYVDEARMKLERLDERRARGRHTGLQPRKPPRQMQAIY